MVKKKTLRFQIYIALALTFLFISVIYALILYPFEKKRHRTVINKIELSVDAIVQQKEYDLANSIFLRHDDAIKLILKKIMKTKEILAAIVYDSKGNIVSILHASKVSGNLVETPLNIKVFSEKYSFTEGTWNNYPVITYTKPILVIGEHLGYLKIHYDLTEVSKESVFSIIIFATLLLTILLSMTILLNIFLSKFVTNPVSELMEAMKKLQTGNLGIQVDLKIDNEIGEMAQTFNQMSFDNAAMYKELDDLNKNLEKIVEERTIELIQARKLESIGTLAGGIAHDFNNLLTSILGNINLVMLDMDPQEKPYTLLSYAEKASLSAKDLSQQLLTFSKGGSPIKKTTSIADLIKDASTFSVKDSNVKYEFDIDENLSDAEVDTSQMTQVINNLIINASHAMKDGGVIKISCSNVTMDENNTLKLRKGEYIKVSIRDTGIGIPEENIDKIFDPYFTTKEKGTDRGNGLGLATCYSVIKRHSGHITVESKVNQGTTFHIYLPVTAQEEQTPITEQQPTDKKTTDKGKILVMDDEEMIQELIGEILSRIGYTVCFASNGTEAIELYKEAIDENKPFDVVIMDLTIPNGLGGKEAIKKLIEINPAVKAVVSSGHSSDPIVENYRDYGFKGAIIKPYKIKDVSTTINKIIKED